MATSIKMFLTRFVGMLGRATANVGHSKEGAHIIHIVVEVGVEEVVRLPAIDQHTVSLLVLRLTKKTEGGAQEINSQACTAFEAGRLKSFSDNWKKITNDQNILDIVQHFHIEFIETENPVQSQCYFNNFSVKESLIVD